MIFQEKYKSGNYVFPFDEIDPKLKDKDWGRNVGEALYRLFLNDQAGLLYSRRNDYVTYRLYSEGMQPTYKYMDRLAPADKNGERKGFMNISWEILPIIPKFKAIFLGLFDQLEHNINCVASDKSSIEEKENAKWELWAKVQLATQGIQMQIDQQVVPRNVDELELFQRLGFKLRTEIAVEQFLKNGFFYYSNWSEIKPLLLGSVFDTGVGAARDYIENGLVKGRYVDVANLIVSYSNRNTFDNADKIGEVVPYRIADLRPKLMAEGYTEQQIEQVAGQYLGVLGNPNNWIDRNVLPYNSVYNFYPYDDFKVLVLDYEWDSDNVYINKTKTTKSGKTIREEVPYTQKGKEGTEDTCIQVVYQNKWVIGTEMSFDFGLLNETPRESSRRDKKKDKPRKSFHLYKTSDRSLCSYMIPMADDIQLAVLKWRNANAMAAPKGMAYEMSTLENITIGGKKMHPFKIMEIRRQTGDLVYRATTHHSQVISPNSSMPAREIEGGVGIQLDEWIKTIDYNIGLMRQAIGINEITDGTNSNPRQAVGVSEMLSASTNNALQPIYKAYKSIKERIARNAVLRLQCLAKNNDMSQYYAILGDADASTLEALKDIDKPDFIVRLELKPDATRKQFLRDLIAKGLQTPLEQGGLSSANAFIIEDQMENGDLKLAFAYLSYYEDKNKQDALDFQQQNIKAQQQSAQQTEQAKAQMLMQQKAAEFDAQKQLAQLAFDNQLALADVMHKYKLEEIQMEGQYGIQGKAYTADRTVESAQVKSQAEIEKQLLKSGHEQVSQDKEHKHELVLQANEPAPVKKTA